MRSRVALPERIELSPLTEATRNERRALLLVTIIVVAVFYGGFMPAKIEQLGIEFASKHQIALNTLLLLVHIYLLIEFTLHARVEKLAWRRYVAKLRVQALPSLTPLLSKIDMLSSLGDAAKLRREVRDVSTAVDEIKSLVGITVFERVMSILSAYESLTQLLSYKRSLKRNPDHDVARLLLEDTNVDRIIEDIDKIRQPEYSWQELGRPRTRRDAQRYLHISTARLLTAIDEATQFHGVAAARIERVRRQVLYRHEIIETPVQVAIMNLSQLWEEYCRLVPAVVNNQPFARIVASDVHNLKAFAAEAAQSNHADELSWQEARIIRAAVAAPAVFTDLERSVALAFSRIQVRTWFDFELPSIIGALVFVGACARFLWVAA